MQLFSNLLSAVETWTRGWTGILSIKNVIAAAEIYESLEMK
jgi:hypothetical protein